MGFFFFASCWWVTEDEKGKNNYMDRFGRREQLILREQLHAELDPRQRRIPGTSGGPDMQTKWWKEAHFVRPV